jgi:DNA mismatch endonuclease, patch repair protein
VLLNKAAARAVPLSGLQLRPRTTAACRPAIVRLRLRSKKCSAIHSGDDPAALPVSCIGVLVDTMPQPTSSRQRPDFSDVSPARRRNLAAVRGKNTKPELVVRQLLYSLGYRYRLHRRDLPGRPDVVFPGRRAVVEIRGCFWHRHPDPTCRNAALPRTRADWWAAKLAANVQRDRRNEATLVEAGWRVLVLWECEVRGDRDALTEKLIDFLGPAGFYKPPE